MPRRRLTALPLCVALTAAVLGTACSSIMGEAAAAKRPTTAATATTTTRAPTTSAPTASASTASAAPVFVPAPVEWQSCGRNVKCATLTVPLDYADPSGPTITLGLNELPARQPNNRIGALLVNPGGPGGSGLDFVAGGIALPASVLDRFDIVGFDPRGVGQSSNLACGDNTVPPFRRVDSTPDTPEEQVALDAAAKAIADDCAANAGPLLDHLGTDDVVRDMDTIRQALGEDKLNYLGISYGSLLGLRYATLFPNQMRAIAIDGVVDPTQDFEEYLRQQTIAFEKQLNAIFDACPDGGKGCPPGGAGAAYDELARRVEATPMNGSNGQVLGPSELATAALIPTYEPSAVPTFYQALTRAIDGDPSVMLQFSDAFESVGKYTVYAGVECTDSPHPIGSDQYRAFAAELEGLSPRFGGAVANELLPCAFWPAPVHSIVGPVRAPGAPAMLVIGNTGDAATPYQQAVDVAATLQNGRLLTYEGDGHAAYGKSTCAANAEAAYFVDLSLPPEGDVCSN